jgi:alpha-1,6-mannosyltransferase
LLTEIQPFHTFDYASTDLGIATLALREFLPLPTADSKVTVAHHRLGIYLLVLAGVIFRSELALLLAGQVLHLLYLRRLSIQETVSTGVKAFLVAIAISVPIDSYFWQYPLWPELSSFYYNAIQGNSTNWGTSPYHFYFTNAVPRLLLNPLAPVLILGAFLLPSSRSAAINMLLPVIGFIAIYSLQPHKEARFIIYAVPPLTATAALIASYIHTRRAKNLLYRLGSLILLASVLASFAASTVLLAISSQNYPGGKALTTLHNAVNSGRYGPVSRVRVHMDVLSCMTGVTRFISPQSTLSHEFNADTNTTETRVVLWEYDKTEDEATLLLPEFWEQFDFVLAERPEKVIGKWEVVKTIYSFAGMEILRPGQESRWASPKEQRILEEVEGVPSSSSSSASPSASVPATEDGAEAAALVPARVKPSREGEPKRVAIAFQGNYKYDSSSADQQGWTGSGTAFGLDEDDAAGLKKMAEEFVSGAYNEEIYIFVRDFLRMFTGGWWIGPRMEGKVKILRRV